VEVGLEPLVATGGEPLCRVVAVEEPLVEKLLVTGELVDRGDQLEPGAGDRNVVRVGAAGAHRDPADARDQALETLAQTVSTSETPGHPNVPRVRELVGAKRPRLEGSGELIVGDLRIHPIS
jgi:hypothetical protein